MCSAGYHEKIIGGTYFGGDQVTQLNLVLYNTIKWPYQPKHSPSYLLIYHFYTDSGEDVFREEVNAGVVRITATIAGRAIVDDATQIE